MIGQESRDAAVMGRPLACHLAGLSFESAPLAKETQATQVPREGVCVWRSHAVLSPLQEG